MKTKCHFLTPKPSKKDSSGAETVLDGFSLTEVVIALLIIGFALFPLADMFYAGVEIASRSGRDAVALALAQNKMEELLAFTAGDLAPEGPGRFSAEFPAYVYQVRVEDYTGPPQMKKLTVTVFPQDLPGEAIQLVTLRR